MRKNTVTNADFEEVPILDIRQKLCWDNYAKPTSKTFGNATRSAIAAGYMKSTARNITSTPWFSERLLRLNMLGRAEKVLKKALVMNTQDAEGKEQAELLRIQTDVAKHVTKTLGKDEGYSERSELTGKDGSPIVFMPAELLEKYSLTEDNEK